MESITEIPDVKIETKSCGVEKLYGGRFRASLPAS